MAIHYLSVQEVISINILIIQKYSPGEKIGILSQPLLESAVYRLQQSAFGEDAYPTIIEKPPRCLNLLDKIIRFKTPINEQHLQQWWCSCDITAIYLKWILNRQKILRSLWSNMNTALKT